MKSLTIITPQDPVTRHETKRNQTPNEHQLPPPPTEQFHRHLFKVRHTQRPYPLRYGSKGAWRPSSFVPRARAGGAPKSGFMKYHGVKS